MDAQEDVVARDDLGVDAAISERFDGLHCILLQLIVESYDSEEGVVLEEVLPIALQVGSHFLLVNLLQSSLQSPSASDGKCVCDASTKAMLL